MALQRTVSKISDAVPVLRSAERLSYQMKKTQQTPGSDSPSSFLFLALPGEVRNEIYSLLLLRQEPIDPSNRCINRQLTPGLFCVNKAIRDETCPLLYGYNTFDFSTVVPPILVMFLGKIGSINASYIQNVIIGFPEFLCLDPGKVTLKTNSINMLASIQNGCSSLRTLRTSPHSTIAMEFQLWDLKKGHLKVADEALEVVDRHFRTISPLLEIIIEVNGTFPTSYMRKKIASRGWTTSTTKYGEDEKWRFTSGGLEYYCGNAQ